MYRLQSLAIFAALVGVFALVAYFIFGWLAVLVVLGLGVAFNGLYMAGLLRRFRFIYTSEQESGSRWLRTHPPTEERVQALLEQERETTFHSGPRFQDALSRTVRVAG